MKKFKAFGTRDGNKYGGEFEALDEQDARKKLEAQGFHVDKIEDMGDSFNSLVGILEKKKKISLLIIAVSILIITVLVGYFVYARTPKYSLLQIRKAVATHDLDSFNKYVDIDSLLDGISDVSFDNTDFVNSLKSQMAQLIKKQINVFVETGELEKRSDENLLGTRFIVEIYESIKNRKKIAFKGIVNCKEEGKIAYIGFKFISIGKDTSVILTIKMRNKGSYWQVVQLKDFKDFSDFIVEATGLNIEVDRKLIEAAKTDIEANLSLALELYSMDMRSFPSSLDYLSFQPLGSKNWRGPYMKKMAMDPWGHFYVYKYPGEHNPATYDLYSLGKDGQFGTEDDIKNWE